MSLTSSNPCTVGCEGILDGSATKNRIGYPEQQPYVHTGVLRSQQADAQGPGVVLGVGRFLMGEVPLYGLPTVVFHGVFTNKLFTRSLHSRLCGVATSVPINCYLPASCSTSCSLPPSVSQKHILSFPQVHLRGTGGPSENTTGAFDCTHTPTGAGRSCTPAANFQRNFQFTAR